MGYHRRRSICYRRFDAGYESYSKSYNAICAERAGRFPRTRAAAHLGISAKAFDAGCKAAGYTSTEFHHVGKYATCVDYYDTEALKSDWKFWLGVAKTYSAKMKRREFLGRAAAIKFHDRAPIVLASIRFLSAFQNGCLYCGPFVLLLLDRRRVKVVSGPGLPAGCIVDKSLFNDYRVPCAIQS